MRPYCADIDALVIDPDGEDRVQMTVQLAYMPLARSAALRALDRWMSEGVEVDWELRLRDRPQLVLGDGSCQMVLEVPSRTG